MVSAAAAGLLLADWLILDTRRQKAIADIVFVVVMWASLANVFLDPVKRALHPDSPVMNSGWEIKGPFFGMVIAIFLATMVLAWLASQLVRPEAPVEAPADETSQARIE